MSRLIGITGGIGAGKSIVSAILRCIGYPVYDCDAEAKRIMAESEAIKRRIALEIAEEALNAGGEIDRKTLAAIVFADAAKLAILNEIVHGAVRADLKRWHGEQQCATAFVESAIMQQSGLDAFVDGIWEVTAPEEVRIERVCRRNSISPEDVKQRIRAQKARMSNSKIASLLINNDGRHSLLIQIDRALKDL